MTIPHWGSKVCSPMKTVCFSTRRCCDVELFMRKPLDAQLPNRDGRNNSGRVLQLDGKSSACRKNDHNHSTSLRLQLSRSNAFACIKAPELARIPQMGDVC